jgi:hypothetical protein
VAGDVVGIYFDKDANQIRFWVNGTSVLQETFTSEADKFYQLTAAFDKEGIEAIISNDCSPPEEIDLLGLKSVDTVNATEWGYKFKVTPQYRGENKMNIIQSLNEKQTEKWNKYVEKQMKIFTRDIDEQLVAYIDEYCMIGDKDPLTLEPEDVKPKPTELVYYPSLEKIKLVEI